MRESDEPCRFLDRPQSPARRTVSHPEKPLGLERAPKTLAEKTGCVPDESQREIGRHGSDLPEILQGFPNALGAHLSNSMRAFK